MKVVNNKFGHCEGDILLQDFADTIQRDARFDGLLARLGGDEFVLFLEVADFADGTTIARNFHKAANSVPKRQGGLSRCSVGALIVPPGAVHIDMS
ncbi:diguanylate cyclase [Qipengyuania sp. CAU 1752]